MDSVKQMIDFVLTNLDINKAYLGGLLGVSERTVAEWQTKGMGELPPKAKRLQRLVDVINFMKVEGSSYKLDAKSLMLILQNGRIPMDGEDEDSNSIALLGYITAFPEEKGWQANVRVAMDDFAHNFRIEAGGR